MDTPSRYRCVLTSEDHLSWFFQLEEQTAVWRKLLGFSAVPKDFPRLTVPHVALPFFAAGDLEITADGLTFTATPLKVRGLRAQSLQEELCWRRNIREVADAHIFSPEGYDPIPRGANLNWIKLAWNDEHEKALLVAELDEFLMPNAVRSDRLLNRLRLLLAVRKWRDEQDTNGEARANEVSAG